MSEEVKNMFTGIAESYDKTNDIFSFGMHRSWKTQAIQMAEIQDGDDILDIATGTGDLAIEIFEKHTITNITGLDFSPGMLEIARKRSNKINFIEGDALDLPFSDNSINKCFISYGIRNVDSVEKCLQEIYRVLTPNGRLIILETGKPDGIIYYFYRIYTKYILPNLGKIISNDKSSYKYLAETAKSFPYGKEFLKIINESVSFKDLYLKKLCSKS